MARPENPAAWFVFFFFLFTGFHVCSSVSWECAAGLFASFRELCGWNWISFAPSKICRFGICFSSRLVVFIKPYPVSVSQLPFPSVLCWARDSLVVAVVCPTDCNPTNATVTPNTSESTVSLWFPLDTTTSNLGSQVAEVRETVPAGAGILPGVNYLHSWDPRAHEPHLQVISASFQHSKHGREALLLSLTKLLIRCFRARQRILNVSIFILT